MTKNNISIKDNNILLFNKLTRDNRLIDTDNVYIGKVKDIIIYLEDMIYKDNNKYSKEEIDNAMQLLYNIYELRPNDVVYLQNNLSSNRLELQEDKLLYKHLLNLFTK